MFAIAPKPATFAVASHLLFWLGSVTAIAQSPPLAEQIEFFEKSVRPLLIAHCGECHGAKKAEAGLRLDSRAGFLRGIEGVPVVVAGEPDRSRLLQVMRYDGDVQMPPDGKLPAAAITTITRWIKTGAAWPEDKQAAPTAANTEAADFAARIAAARTSHWSFQPVRAAAPPNVANDAWCRTSIDRFILAELEKNKLPPSPAAERQTWLRRVTFDLLGLPPTFDEMNAFAADTAPDAAARVLDRLLASPHYGERWGRHWLDLARYADTKGYAFQQDRRFPYAYTYRDYVVRSLNEDLPFDQFVREQLAADLLPPRDENRSLAALGLLTVGRRFNNIHDDTDDRIDVVTRGLLGLTVTCARCHDHKFEAVPSEDYYSLYGIFRSTIEPGELPLIGQPVSSPETLEFQAELAKRQETRRAGVAVEIEKTSERLRTNFTDFLAVIISDKFGAAALRDYKVTRAEIKSIHANRWKDFINRNAMPWTNDTVAEKGSAAAGKKMPDPIWGLWHHFYKLAERNLPDAEFATAAAQVRERLGNDQPLGNMNRLVREAFAREAAPTMIDVAKIYGRLFDDIKAQWTTALAAATKDKAPAPTQLPDADAEALRQVLYGAGSPTMLDEAQARSLFDVGSRDRTNALQKKIDELTATSPGAPPRAMVLNDAPQPFNPYVFVRGNPDRRGKNIPRQFLGVLSGDPRSTFAKGSGRLELANAIVDRQNPLTARVFVNRVWQHHFGTGLVRTTSNFGERGEPPTHPALLDALAANFMNGGWSIKTLHREMLLSAVFSQTTQPNARGLEIDSDNRWLWRMNRRRLEFEPQRDALLFVAGELDTRLGGRPVDLTANPAPRRRTIYGMIDRQDLPDLFRTFDFASPDVSTEQRPDTTVPQQALYAMNSKFVAEQSRKLAARVLADLRVGADASPNTFAPSATVPQLYQRVLARVPDADELRAAQEFLAQAAAKTNPQTVDKYLTPLEQLAQILVLTNEFAFVD